MFVINVRGNIISVQETEPITSGSVNVYQCQFVFDDSWEGFFRSAVFRVGPMVRTVPLDPDDMCELPWELLVKKNIGLPVEVSVYGAKDETEILPTIWDKMGRVRSGSEPGEDVKDPTPTVYNQLTNIVRLYSEKVTEESEAAAKYAAEANLSAQDAHASAQTATAAVSGINAYVAAAAVSAAAAKESETKAIQSAEAASASAAEAEAWSKKAEHAAGGGIISFNGRGGAVEPQSGDYTAAMVGADVSGAAESALLDAKAYTDGKVPTKVSQLTNDRGYLTGYTETDPTVPAWAKAASKPTYTASEVGAATSSHTHTPASIGAASNPNLLRNWYFVNCVNQRGQLEYLIKGYAIDGWKQAGTEFNLTVNNGISLAHTNGAFTKLVQCVEHAKQLAGKKVTLSVMASGTANMFAFLFYNGSTSGTGIGGKQLSDTVQLFSSTTLTLPDDLTSLELGIGVLTSSATGVVNLHAVKLELGDTQTLAHQENGVWVLNEIPDYNEELMKCCMSTAEPADAYANNKKTPTAIGAAPTIQYGTSDVTAGAASSYAEGTLYVVIE